MRRILLAMVLGSLGLAAPAAAAPARVVDVRLGVHKGYTRIVLQLDGPVEYRIRRQSLPAPTGQVTELAVEIDQASGAFALARKTGIVQSVRVKPQGEGAIALIRLSVDGPRVADMTLKSPDRIVIDVRPPLGQASAAAATTAKPAPKPKAAAPKPVAKTAPKPEAKAAPPPALPPAPAAATTIRPPAPGPPPGTEAPQGPGSPGTPGGHAPLGAVGREMADAGKPAAAPPGKPSPAKPMQPRTPPAPKPKPAASDDGGGGFGILPIVLIVAALLAVWLFLRRRSMARSEAVRDTLPDFPPVDALDASEAQDGGAGTVSEADLAGPAREGAEPVAFASEDDEDLPAMPGQEIPPRPARPSTPEPEVVIPGAAAEEPKPDPAPAQAAFGAFAAPSESAAPVAGDPILAEIERRLRHIETRIEEVADARERMDRQLAAHTEELRVQRSAIARAQRVLRNLTRPEEADPPPSGGPPSGGA